MVVVQFFVSQDAKNPGDFGAYFPTPILHTDQFLWIIFDNTEG